MRGTSERSALTSQDEIFGVGASATKRGNRAFFSDILLLSIWSSSLWSQWKSRFLQAAVSSVKWNGQFTFSSWSFIKSCHLFSSFCLCGTCMRVRVWTEAPESNRATPFLTLIKFQCLSLFSGGENTRKKKPSEFAQRQVDPTVAVSCLEQYPGNVEQRIRVSRSVAFCEAQHHSCEPDQPTSEKRNTQLSGCPVCPLTWSPTETTSRSLSAENWLKRWTYSDLCFDTALMDNHLSLCCATNRP